MNTRAKRKPTVELANPYSPHLLTCGSFAEMDKLAKNKISHRSLALQKLRFWFEEQ